MEENIFAYEELDESWLIQPVDLQFEINFPSSFNIHSINLNIINMIEMESTDLKYESVQIQEKLPLTPSSPPIYKIPKMNLTNLKVNHLLPFKY